MNVLPVINRELRAEARHAFTYWLRVIGAGAVIAVACFFILMHGFRVDEGAILFAQLHGTLHGALWIMVPLLAADCISRERREGTLGLLFLTPLRARDIVLAKSLAHGLRAATLLLAVLPVITLPLLIGGVSWRQAVASLLLNAAALCLALAAGLVASALSKTWVRSLLLALGLAVIFAISFSWILGGLFSKQLGFNNHWRYNHWMDIGPQLALGLDPDFVMSSYAYRHGAPHFVNPNGATTFQAVLTTAGYALIIGVVVLLIAGLVAATLTSRNWQERPAHPVLVWFRRRLCTPVIMLDVLRDWMKRKLESNPIGWLEQRTWSGRLVIWGWLAVMISIYSLLLTSPSFLTNSLTLFHGFMGWLLLGSMALNASTSFRRERETRVLELLLVSPLSEWQIILGRLRGLWGQFLPSMTLLLGGWTYLAVALDHFDENWQSILLFACSFAALPVVGLYFSLNCRNFFSALIWTLVVGMVLPTAATRLFGFAFHSGYGPGTPDFTLINMLVVQTGLAAVLISLLHYSLVQRQFAMETT